MNTFVKCKNLQNQIDLLCTPIGMRLLSKNWKFSILTLGLITAAVSALICTCYTQYMKFLGGNYLDGCSSFIYYGLEVQGLAKLFISLINRPHYQLVAVLIPNIHKQHQNHPVRKEILISCYNRCEILSKFCFYLYVTSFACYLSLPAFIYIYNGKRLLMIEMWLPGVNHETIWGYWITILVQIIFMCYLVFGLLAVDIYFVVVSVHFACLCELFEVSLKELGDELKYDTSSKYQEKIKQKIRCLIIEHGEMFEFLHKHNKMYSMICFFQAGATILTSTASLFLGTVRFRMKIYNIQEWSVGIVTLSQLLLFCTVGTVLEVWNEKAVSKMYEVPWHYLNRDRGTEFLIMYKNAQEPKLLSLGGFLPLSVSTALDILKKMYSYYMMFMTFIEDMEF